MGHHGIGCAVWLNRDVIASRPSLIGKEIPMAATPPSPAGPSRTTVPFRPWDRQVLTAITATGQAALGGLDPRSSMVALLRQQPHLQPWRQRAQHLATLYARPEDQCHRLMILAESRGWLSLQCAPPPPPLAMREVLRRIGLLTDARIAALDRRLRPGHDLAVSAFARDLAGIGWLGHPEAAFLVRLDRLASWHWA
jgi:hypothetical protein